MEKRKISKKMKKVISAFMAAVLVMGTIPTSVFLNDVLDVRAAASYSPQVLGVGVLCKDLATDNERNGNKATKIYDNLVQKPSYSENTKRGSIYNNVSMFGYRYSVAYSGGGGTWYTDVKTNYPVLYTLARQGDIYQNVMAYITNDKHGSFINHWHDLVQAGKIILGYPVNEKNERFYLGLSYNSEGRQSSGEEWEGDRNNWDKMSPNKGYGNRLAIYLTTKLGCQSCGSSKIEKVSVGLKDETQPKIKSIKITGSETSEQEKTYFKEGETLYVHMKFDEHVRLADNNANSAASKNIKLALSLGKNEKADVTKIEASLISLKDDKAVFSYTIPKTVKVDNKDQAVDFFVSGLADINNQKSLIVKSNEKEENKFTRNFVDLKGNTLSDTSGTMKALKKAVSEENYNKLKKTTSAITDLAGNPLSLDGFRDQSAGKAGMTLRRAVLDTVNPEVQAVYLSTNQPKNKEITTANAYLKVGSSLEIALDIGEKLQNIATNKVSEIQAVLNLTDKDGNPVTANAEKISYNSKTQKTTLTFQTLTIEEGMKIQQDRNWSYNQFSDYKITIKEIKQLSVLKDYSGNAAVAASDLRAKTSEDYFLDQEAPVILIDGEEVSDKKEHEDEEQKKYEMARMTDPLLKSEIYSLMISVTDRDTVSGSSLQPYASGVIGGKVELQLRLQGDDFVYDYIEVYLSDVPIKASEIQTYPFNIVNKTDTMMMELKNIQSDLYIYVKFADEVNYDKASELTIDLKAEDLMGNAASATAKYNYSPLDKTSPTISFENTEIIQEETSMYENVKFRICDDGGINIDDIKYIWTEEETAPNEADFTQVVDRKNIEIIKTQGDLVKECLVTIPTKTVKANEIYKASLYVLAKDISFNKKISDKLADVKLDMTFPVGEIIVPKQEGNTQSSLIVSGPYTTSTNEVAMFVAIQDPKAKDYYFVRSVKGQSSEIALHATEFLDADKLPFSAGYDSAELENWSYAQLTQTDSDYRMDISYKLTDTNAKVARKRFQAIAGNMYYGNVSVLAGTGMTSAAFTFEGDTSITFHSEYGQLMQEAFTMVPKKYSLSAGVDVTTNDKYLERVGDINNATIKANGKYGKQVERSTVGDSYNPEKDGPEYLSSLAGASFKISFSNVRDASFGMQDIDYYSKNTYIRLVQVMDGYTIPIYQFPFVAGKETQTVTIPENLQLENGQYRIVVRITSQDSRTDSFEYSDIYLYNYEQDMTEAFGLRSIDTTMDVTIKDNLEEISHAYAPYYGWEEGEDYHFQKNMQDDYQPNLTSSGVDAYQTDRIYLGNCEKSVLDEYATVTYERQMHFSVNGLEETDQNNFWVKVWTGDNEAAASWFPLQNYDTENSIMTFDVTPIDAKAKYQIASDTEYYQSHTNSQSCEIPVFEGSNVVSYRLMNQGGIKSQIHQLEVYYSTEAPAFQMEQEDGVNVAVSETVNVTELDSSLVTKEIEVYEPDLEGNGADAQATEERSFTYTENGRHIFYVLDGYHNLNYQQFHIQNMDNMETSLEFTSIESAQLYDWLDVPGVQSVLYNLPTVNFTLTDEHSLRNANVEIVIDGTERINLSEYEYEDYADSAVESYSKDIYLYDDPNSSVFRLWISGGKTYDGSYYLSANLLLKNDADLTKENNEKIDHKIEVFAKDEFGNEPEPLDSSKTGEEFYGYNQLPEIVAIDERISGTTTTQMKFSNPVRVLKIDGIEVPRKAVYASGDQLISPFVMGTTFEIKEACFMNNEYDAETGEVTYLAKDYFGLSRDGEHEIEYQDIRGNIYTKTFEFENYFGSYGADIQYSTTEKTNGDVIATITGENEKAVLSLVTNDYGIDDPEAEEPETEDPEKNEKYEIVWNKDKTKATITFHENASVPFRLTIPGAPNQEYFSYSVNVSNIDKTAPSDVKVKWHIKETGEVQEGENLQLDGLIDNITDEDIEVWIESESEELYEIDGKELKHTFSYSEDMERSYTFTYRDEAGNVGEPITVTLPEELVMTEYVEKNEEEGIFAKDTEAPQVSAKVYAVYDGFAEYFSAWNPETEDFAVLAEELGYAGGYKIAYTLTDMSKTKLIVLNGLNADTSDLNFDSRSDQIDGLQFNEVNKTLVITKPGKYTVVAIDKEGNLASHSFEAVAFDTEGPEITVEKVGQSFTKMRLKFYADDKSDPRNAKGTIIPVSEGLQQGFDDGGIYYYRDVEYNGVYQVTFKDRSGNRQTSSANVTEIDRDAPKITVSSWTPCYVSNGIVYDKEAPTEPTNHSVVVSLDFNKTTSELKVFYQQGEEWIEDSEESFSKANIELSGRKGKVEFFASVPGIVKIVATAPNGVSNELSGINLVGIIDKEAPQITMNKNLENNKMQVVFKADEQVLVNGAGLNKQYGQNTNIPLTIEKNGTYLLTFTDMAGNITTQELEVTEIDEIPPVVYAAGIPETYMKVSDCEIKVTMSEAGTLTFHGTSYQIKEPEDKDGDGEYTGDELDWVTLPIKANGSYQIKAVDEAGLSSIRVLEVKYLDSKAPNIQFMHSVVNVFSGTTPQELESQLLDETDYILWDDVDPKPTVELQTTLDEAQLKNQGIHEVVYLLKDNVGNTRTVKRYVKVISSANLKITANGQMLLPCDTTILKTGVVDLQLEKSKRTGESFKVYYKNGIRKAGDMKNAKSVKNGKLENLDSGFYTLYIVTQNKETYLTYLYIDKEQ